MIQSKRLYLIIASSVFLAGAIIFFAFYFRSEKKDTETRKMTSLAQAAAENLSFPIPSDWLYPEAPNPDTSREAFNRSRELWPDIGNPQGDEARREQVRQEWRDFAARYPQNIFIPNEFKKLSSEEKEQIRKTNELAATFAARQAEFRASEKYRSPGENPPSSNAAAPNPAEQRAWLTYKIAETRSLIEITEYFLEKAEPTREQHENAKKDLARLRKQMKEYEETLAQVPK